MDSFLVDITAQILAKKDEDCLDSSGAKIETDGSKYMVDQ
eukprot:SAG31_NODE_18840_length_621_cov_0.687739_1_plen_39_part_10